MIPRILRSTSNVDLKTKVLGHNFSLPFGFAPWALGKLAHEDGEIIPATVAGKYNICYTLSILSNTHPKMIQHANKEGCKFLQLYLSNNWSANKKAIKIAEECGFAGLVITVDCPLLGKRRGSVRIPIDYGAVNYPIL